MIALSLLLAFTARAGNDTSSAALYEYLAAKGFETYHNKEGGFVQMQSFSCNSLYLKDIKLQSYQCWYSAAKNSCKSDEIVHETDELVAKPLFEAMQKMGLNILRVNNSEEDWSQIDADNLGCQLTNDYTTEPMSKHYTCWAMKKLKN